jgi:isopenicillin-N epimerase
MEREPVRFLWREIEARIDTARATLAQFLNAEKDGLGFVTNATSAVNAVVRSLELRPGDELLTTSHGYNACRNILTEAARLADARVVVAEIPFPISDSGVVKSAVLNAVTNRTRLVLIDHVTSPTALVFPVEEIVRELETRDVRVIVDGAHAPGMLPLNLAALGASYYTGNLHKWVCAPKGAAFICAKAACRDGLHPATLSHGYNTPRAGRSRFHDEFDWQGTMDVTSWLSVPAAIAFCEALLPGGFPALMQRNHELVTTARRMLCERLEIEAPCPESMIGCMATLPLPERFQNTAGESRAVISRFDPLQTLLFEKHGIEMPLIRFGPEARRWFRISAHAHNALEDYERLASALADC